MKLKSKIIAFVALLGLFLGFSTNVSALENNDYVGVSPNPPGYSNEIVPYGTSKPSDTWSWSNKEYPMSGTTSNTVLYTNYLFTGVTKLRVKFTKADEAITFEVWERNTGLFQSDKKVGSKTVTRLTAEDISKGNTREDTVTGLNASSKYYVRILPPAHFSAKIYNS